MCLAKFLYVGECFAILTKFGENRRQAMTNMNRLMEDSLHHGLLTLRTHWGQYALTSHSPKLRFISCLQEAVVAVYIRIPPPASYTTIWDG